MPRDLPSVRRAVTETLEARRLLAFTGGNFDVPLRLDFSFPVTGVEDAGGLNTGFPIVQGNTAGDEYQPALIDLDTDAGLLRLTSRGDSINGSAFRDDNTLANGLQVPFDGTQDWVAHARITSDNAPLSQFDQPFEQAGLLVGATQDNYAKLVLVDNGVDTVVQFLVELDDGTGFRFPLTDAGAVSNVTGVQGVNLATADYIDLWIAGDPDTGTLSAQYRVEGGLTVRLPQTVTLTGVDADRFFRDQSRAGLTVSHKNDAAPVTAAFDFFEILPGGLPSNVPAVREARPADGDDNVFRDAFVAVDLALPDASVDGSTLTGSNVFLTRVRDGFTVPSEINTTGGGDSIILTPLRALDADETYRFEITSGVTDLFGTAFEPFSSTFTTNFELAGGGSIGTAAFEQVELPAADGTIWSSVVVGPDGKLYATAINGPIARWTIGPNGGLTDRETFNSLVDAEGGPRIVTGLTFAPDSTAGDLVAYVSHTQFNDFTTSAPADLGDDFTGKLTRLSGPTLGTVEDLVIGLPRSIRDHLNNQPVFGPDGRIYFGQGSNTAMGAPDPAWGFRDERQLSGAVIAVDVEAIEAGSGPVNVQTAEGGTYDPDAPGAPVTVFGEGVRNAYDLVWHSNGNLYAPTNGSAAGGNTPQSPGGAVPALDNVSQTQNDYLFRIEPGGYYGHPNSTRDNFVLNGGNPTPGPDPAEVPDYTVGLFPDPDYRGFAFDFGKNISPNGVIEYTGDAFNGALDGKLIVTRWSGGDDLIVLDLDASGNVIGSTVGLPGFTGFAEPLDLAQTADGTLYVSEYGEQTITLLRPVGTDGDASVADRRSFIDAAAGTAEVRPFTVTNDGDGTLLLNPYTIGLVGTGRDAFEFVNPPLDPVALDPDESFTFQVRFNAPASADVGDTFEATAFIRTSDPDAPEVGTRFTGLVKRGDEGANEPSLQDIFDVYGLGIDTGDSDPTTTAVDPAELLAGDGVAIRGFEVVDPDRPVAFETIAVYSPDAEPVISWGYYDREVPQDRTRLSEIATSQGLAPLEIAPAKFSPDTADGTFGIYLQSPVFVDDGRGRIVTTDAGLNTWEAVAAERQKAIAYEIPGVDDAWVLTFEEFDAANDYNDLVIVFRNVRPIGTGGAALAALEPDGEASPGHLAFSTIPVANRDDRFGIQQVRDVRPVELLNTAETSITLDSATATGPFAVTGFTPATLQPGERATVQVRFTATTAGPDAGLYDGDLAINYTAGGSARSLGLTLGGFFMPYSEDDIVSTIPKPNEEPTLDEIVATFGYAVDVGTNAERLTGTSDAVGEEVLSAFWRAAEVDRPVEVYQIAAFHNTNTDDAIFWFPESSATSEAAAAADSRLVFQHDNTYAQSILPAILGGSDPAFGSFQTDQTFGFRVAGEYSVDEFNDDNFGDSGDDLHLFRFYPLRGADGDVMEDTYLMAMDFTGFNFDYNDNVYVVKNIEPADLAPPPVGLTAGNLGNGTFGLYWGAPDGVDRFRVFASVGDTDSFEIVRAGTARNFAFLTGIDGSQPVYARVQSLDGSTLGSFGDIRIV
jgi:glucose/arabinose dehydrogenase